WGMWSLSPRISCSVCLPGVRLTSASVWPEPKCRLLKSFGIGLSSGGGGAAANRGWGPGFSRAGPARAPPPFRRAARVGGLGRQRRPILDVDEVGGGARSRRRRPAFGRGLSHGRAAESRDHRQPRNRSNRMHGGCFPGNRLHFSPPGQRLLEHDLRKADSGFRKRSCSTISWSEMTISENVISL